MSAEALSIGLRHGSGPYLARRRMVVGASLAAMASLSVVALYQMGVIAHLPDPPLPGFNADRVHGSATAYALSAMPDAVLGLGSYAATTMLAAMGGPDRPEARPWIPLALAAKAVFDLVQTGRLTSKEVMDVRALSLWSALTAVATTTTAALVMPETRAAARQVLAGYVNRRGERAR